MALAPRRGLETIQYPPRITVAIRPILGQWSYDSAEDIPLGSSPDMLNCSVFQGMLRKRPGYALYPAGMSSLGHPILGLFSTQDHESNTHLVAITTTGGAKYNVGTQAWDALTGPALTGSTNALFSFENSQNAIVFSQGVDKVMKLPFTSLVYAALNANCPPAKFLSQFNGRLNLGFTVEAGLTLPQAHRYCVRNNNTDWVGLGSGIRETEDWAFPITGLRKIGPQMGIYYDHAIELVTAQPQALAPFRYDVKVADVGLYAPHTLKGRNDQHFFLGNDDFYTFNGVQIKSIGTQIRDYVFSTLNANKLSVMFGELLFDTQEYIAFLVTGGHDIPDTALVYNWQRGIWFPWSINGPRCSCVHQVDDTTTIDSLIGTISAQNWQFDSRILQAAYPALLTGNDDGKVYVWSPQYTSDAGSSIPCKWTSHDFTAETVFQAPGRKLTLEGIVVHYAAVGSTFTLDFSYSIDGGNTWTAVDSMTGEAAPTGVLTGTVDFRISADRIRFKFENDTATESFNIVKFEVEFTLEEAKEHAN